MKLPPADRRSAGFSLIEMLVSVGIFSLVMVVSVVAVVGMVNTNRYARAVKNVADNLAFAMESMSRNIKIGTKYYCGGWAGVAPVNPDAGTNDCAGGSGSIAFRDFRGQVQAYRINDGVIDQYFPDGTGPITAPAPEVEVLDLKFYVVGSSNGDLLQPRVRINVKARSTVGKSEVEYVLQTTVSGRVLDEPQS